MPYRALYRQWRPKDFSSVVGQKAIIDTLRNQVVTDHIAHAYLFCGSRGTGKTSTAKILARAINCEAPENGDPCGKCSNCLRMENEESLDIIEIDAASNNGVDEIRDLRDTVKYPPQFGRYKVYIIDEVHMLSTSAFNALLKTLEEPPTYIVFILATTEPQKLPETILSRCQRFDFGRLTVPEIQNRLQEAANGSGATVSPGALMMIARAAEGGMRDALSLLDMCLGYGNEIDEKLVRSILGTSDKSFLFGFAEALIGNNLSGVFQMIDRLMRDGKDPAVFAREISNHFRSLLLAKSCPDTMGSILDLTEEDAAEYIRQAETLTLTRLMKMLELFMALETEMRYSSSPRIALENTSIKCCVRTKEADQQALLDRMAEMENRIVVLEEKIRNGVPVQTVKSVGPEEKKGGKAEKKKEEPPPAPAKIVNSDDASVWKEMMSRMKKNEPGIWSLLTQGNMIGTEKGVFRWMPEATEGEQFFLMPLNSGSKKEKICQILTEIAGKDCGFEAVGRKMLSKTRTATDNDQDYIQQLYSTFGKEPVDILE